MKKSILIVSFILLLSGCATTHMAKPDKTPDLTFSPDKATLVIFRETWYGGSIVFWNYLDRKLIGETQAKTYFVTHVTPGPHYLVIATENTCAAHFDFKAGKTYFLGEGVTMGFWRARTTGFYPMTPEDAAKAMKVCSYLQYDPNAGQEDMHPQLWEQAIDEYLKEIKEDPEAYEDILKYGGVEMK